MATLKGEGALKEVNLIGEIHKNGVIFNEKGNPESGRKGAWITFQVDQSYAGLKNPSLKGDNPEKPSEGLDTNPYLSSSEVTHPNPTDKDHPTYVSHREYYSNDQIEMIEKAAGKKSFETENATVVGINASLMVNSKGQLVVNTKQPIGPTTSSKSGPKVLENQAMRTKTAKEVRDARKAQLSAEKAGVEAQAVVEVEEPAL